MNKFEALCKLASNENWCWNIVCSTCGHTHFGYAFLELAAGKSPENTDWLINSRRTVYSDILGPWPRRYSPMQKEKVLRICKGANISLIANKCKFPDWLGYLGLVLYDMHTDSETYKAVSDSWASQLKDLVTPSLIAHTRLMEILENYGELLNIKDLELCEKDMLYDY